MSVSYLLRYSVTGSICPSSVRLANAVAGVASGRQKNARELVFAGIGSGVIAKNFLHWNQKATFVDIERVFCDRFAGAIISEHHRVVCTDIVEYLDASPAKSGRLIVSCLPLHGPYFSPKILGALVDEVKRGGIVVFYSYFPLIRGSRLARFLGNARVAPRREQFVAWNFPPAFVYSLTAAERAIDQ